MPGGERSVACRPVDEVDSLTECGRWSHCTPTLRRRAPAQLRGGFSSDPISNPILVVQSPSVRTGPIPAMKIKPKRCGRGRPMLDRRMVWPSLGLLTPAGCVVPEMAFEGGHSRRATGVGGAATSASDNVPGTAGGAPSASPAVTTASSVYTGSSSTLGEATATLLPTRAASTFRRSRKGVRVARSWDAKVNAVAPRSQCRAGPTSWGVPR